MNKLQEAAENMIIKSQNRKISLDGLMIEFHKEQSKEAIQELQETVIEITEDLVQAELENDQLLQQNKELREALKHCVLVFKSQADRGLYPLELMPDNPNYLGKEGFQFALDALSKHPNK